MPARVQPEMYLSYDREYDILYVDVGKPRAAYSHEVRKDILLRIDPKAKKSRVVGITVMNYREKLVSDLARVSRAHRLCLDWAEIDRHVRAGGTQAMSN